MSTPAVPDLDDPSLYINRELSWLEFNRRVLEEAQDPSVPLLERLKFLAIFSSNLDEFFMVRVGGLHQKVVAGIENGSGGDRIPATEQLRRVGEIVRELVTAQYKCLREDVLPALREKGVVVREEAELSAAERRAVADLFHQHVNGSVTPQAIDPTHPFPHLINKAIYLVVPQRRPGTEARLFATVQVPLLPNPRMVALPTADPRAAAFLPLESVLRLHMADLFPGMILDRAFAFRVTRDSEFEVDDDVEDLMQAMEESVKKRKEGQEVRLELEADAPPEVEQFLLEQLGLSADDVFRVPGLIDLTAMFDVHAVGGFAELRDPPFTPVAVRDFAQAPNVWAAIRARDILVHHPYDSFKPVVDLIDAAADDERVVAIKQTLYRTSSDSPIVQALQRAAENDKQVTAVVELKARLDEERNIRRAKRLQKSGVTVAYGMSDLRLKTHCKVALVVRRDEDGVTRKYVHLATGNYNPQTARTYTDIGLFTCHPDFAEDAILLFNQLTGYVATAAYRKLIVAPARLQPFMIERIDRETANQLAGKRGRVVAKVNGLLEPMVVKALYRASQAGVKVDIICRGVCALRPGVPGVSDNIRVISIVDRFLEHSRVFYFESGGTPEVFVGSADWMDRNLSRRVEVVFPVEQPELRQRLIDEVLTLGLADTAKARELLPDGTYRRVKPADGEPPLRSQQRLIELAAAVRVPSAAVGSAVRPATPNDAPPARRPRGKRTP